MDGQDELVDRSSVCTCYPRGVIRHFFFFFKIAFIRPLSFCFLAEESKRCTPSFDFVIITHVMRTCLSPFPTTADSAEDFHNPTARFDVWMIWRHRCCLAWIHGSCCTAVAGKRGVKINKRFFVFFFFFLVCVCASGGIPCWIRQHRRQVEPAPHVDPSDEFRGVRYATVYVTSLFSICFFYPFLE